MALITILSTKPGYSVTGAGSTGGKKLENLDEVQKLLQAHGAPAHLIPTVDFDKPIMIEIPDLTAEDIKTICEIIASGPRLIKHHVDNINTPIKCIEGQDGASFSDLRHVRAIKLMTTLRFVNALESPNIAAVNYEVSQHGQTFYEANRVDQENKSSVS